jgi:hypothetical protein
VVTIEQMWAAVEKAGILTGAWQGLGFAEMPPEVQESFRSEVWSIVEDLKAQLEAAKHELWEANNRD